MVRATIFMCILFVMMCDNSSALRDLYMMGLLPFNGAWSGGDAQLVSMNMALEEVNTREDILPGYRLQLIYNDTECNVATGVNQMFQMLYTPPIKIMILGAGCSFVSEATAQTSHQWNLNQLSYASVSPSLSDKTRFPRFLRMSTPETAHNPARVKILESFKWKKVASIHQSLELFAKLTENLLERLQTANITILTSEIFVYDPAVHVRHLKELDARIIFGNFYVDVARRVFCEAYKQGLYGAKHVWIIQGWYEADWWKIKDENIVCTVDQLSEAVKGYLTTDTFYLDPDNSMGISGMTPDDYQTEFNIRGGEETYASRLAPQGYDAVWAAALALNATAEDLAETGESLGEFTYDDEYIADMILNNIRSLEFQGIKGPVSFDENGDPRSVSKILQLQDGKRITVGIARPSEEIRWLQDSPIIWEAGRPPVDGKKVTILPVRITLSLYVPMCVLSGVGIMLAMALLSFNVLNRENRTIKLSSPNLNNVILVGCLLTYTSVFINDFETNSLLPLHLVCKLNAVFLLLGFTLAFGAMFSKTWRVYRIFTKGTVKKLVVRDAQLIGSVLLLLLLDAIIIVLWEILDPVVKITIELPEEQINDEDEVIQPKLDVCTSQYMGYWMGVIFATKGIMLLLGAFLAWETRKVKIPALNDSQYIGMSLYNVVILCGIGAPMSLILKYQPHVSFGMTSALVILGTTVTQCLVFIPKVLNLKDNKVQSDTRTMFTTMDNHKPSPSSIATT